MKGNENQGKNKKGVIFKVIIIFTLCFIILLPSGLYISRNKIKNLITEKLVKTISKKTGRKISYSKLTYSFKSFEIYDLEISEKNSDKLFAKSKRLMVSMDLINILLNKKELEIDEMDFEDGEINIIKKINWNFQDIIDLLPQDSRPINERYFVDTLVFKNFNFLIKKENTEVLLKNSNLIINHRNKSENFEIAMKSENYLSFTDSNIFFNLDIDSKINFSDKLNRIDTEKLEISDFSYNQFKFENGELKFNIDFSDKKIEYNLNLKKFEGIKKTQAFKEIESSYKKLTSKEINFKEPFDFNIEFKSDRNLFNLKLESDNFKIKSVIDRDKNAHNFEFESEGVSIKSDSELKKPVIKSNLSEMINSLIKKVIISYEDFIMNFFK